VTILAIQNVAQHLLALISSSSSQISFLFDFVVLALAAFVFSLIFARLKISIVAGQILAGLLVGPYVLGWVTDPLVLNQLSQIGVVLLMFIIGLELDPAELRRMLAGITFLTILEVGVAFLFGLLASYVLQLSLLESIIFSMTASITSTAIVGKIFLSRRILRSPESGFLIGLLVIEDMVAVVFLIVLSSITSSNISSFPYFIIGNSASSRGFVAGIEAVLGGLALIGLAYAVSHYIAPRIINYLSYFDVEFEEVPFLFGLGLGFAFALLAALLGYSPGTGAFIVGLSISGKHSKFLATRITPIKDMFLVLFFVSMGGLIDPLPALAFGWPIIIVFLLLVLGKFVGGFSIGKILNVASKKFAGGRRSSFALEGALPSASAFGAWLIPRGEFSLIIAQLGLAFALIDQSLFSLIGISVFITVIVGSVLQRFTEQKKARSVFAFRSDHDEE
jgi:monovalent cation:H+ antiporter-2, CPA2 family